MLMMSCVRERSRERSYRRARSIYTRLTQGEPAFFRDSTVFYEYHTLCAAFCSVQVKGGLLYQLVITRRLSCTEFDGQCTRSS